MIKRLVIVGGPNGSGKSTFSEEYVTRFGISYLGADAIAAELAPLDPLSVRVEAGKQFVRRLEVAIHAGSSRVVESTLAGQGLARHIQQAKRAGFEISLIFITLDNPELCMTRIRERVSLGGHSVPDVDVCRRFGRSRRLFWTLYRPLADSWQLFSNTGDGFDLVATGTQEQTIAVAPDVLSYFLASLESS